LISVDPDAQSDALFIGHLGFEVKHAALHLGRAAHRIDNARKFRQQPVAGDLTMRPRCSAIFGSISCRRCALRRSSVPPHQARISPHIGGEDRGETAGRGHYSSGMPALRRPAK
jgi:hypothetical protein